MGIDNDNIYTQMTEKWQDPNSQNRIWGYKPHESPDTPPGPYPGQNAYGEGANMFSSTDTLIYP